MSHRIEVGVVEAYKDDAAQATVRVSLPEPVAVGDKVHRIVED